MLSVVVVGRFNIIRTHKTVSHRAIRSVSRAGETQGRTAVGGPDRRAGKDKQVHFFFELHGKVIKGGIHRADLRDSCPL